MPHICPVLADVDPTARPPVTLYWQQVFMSMVSYTCSYTVTGRKLWNPTSAKTGQIWGTRHSLRIEISLPDHRLTRGACKKFRLALLHAWL